MSIIKDLDTVIDASNQKFKLQGGARCEAQILRKMANDLLRLADAIERRSEPERRPQ